MASGDAVGRVLEAQNAAWARFLPSSLAHALGTGLQVVGGHASMHESALAVDKRVISRKVREMTEAIQRVLAFARGARPAAQTIHAAEVMRDLTEVLGATAQGRSFTVRPVEEHVTVHGRVDDILVALAAVSSVGLRAAPAIEWAVFEEECQPPSSEAGAVIGGLCAVFRVSWASTQPTLVALARPREPWLQPPAGITQADALALALVYGIARENMAWVEWKQEEGETALRLNLPVAPR